MYTDSEKYLEYSFILNSDSIKKLRKYNKDRNGAEVTLTILLGDVL